MQKESVIEDLRLLFPSYLCYLILIAMIKVYEQIKLKMESISQHVASAHVQLTPLL